MAVAGIMNFARPQCTKHREVISISGLVVEYIVAIDVTRVRFPADALSKRPLLIYLFTAGDSIASKGHGECDARVAAD